MVRTYVYDGDEFTSKADSLRLWRALTNNFETVTRTTGKSLDQVTGADLARAEGSCLVLFVEVITFLLIHNLAGSIVYVTS